MLAPCRIWVRSSGDSAEKCGLGTPQRISYPHPDMSASAATRPAAPRGLPVEEHATLEPTDEALVRRMLDGDTAAARWIWRRYSPAVRSALRSTLGPDDEVEDLLQEVFLRFLKAAPSLVNRDALKPFLISIALRAVGSELRKRRVRRLVGLKPPEELPEQAAPPTDHAARQAVYALYRVLDKLRTRSRVVFVLHYVEGLTHKEIGEIMGLSKITVKRELVRAGAKLENSVAHEPALRAYAAVNGGKNERS